MTRAASDTDLSHSNVHYLFAIHKLKEKRGFARVTDIAKELGLTKGSVSTAINNLKKKNLVKDEEDCKFVVLTEVGHNEVHKILSTRTLLFHFFKDFLEVSSEAAFNDSCRIEHLMSDESRRKLFDYMKVYGCSCGTQDKSAINKLKLSIDLCQFDNEEDYLTWQEEEAGIV